MLARTFTAKKNLAIALIVTFVLFSQGVALAAKPTSPPPTQKARTYASGKGSDSNPCSVSQPCQTLKAALAMTLPGGEIFVLDSANYGSVTINQAVSITAAGAGAGILVTSGSAVVVSAGASDVVNLRGLVLDGDQTATTGIQFRSGAALVVQNAVIRNFATNGINFAPTGAARLLVTDTTVSGNTNGGVLITPAGSNAVSGIIARLSASGNGVGILVSGSNVDLTMTDVVAGGNTYGIGASSMARVLVRNSIFSNNTVGVSADLSALIRVGKSALTSNSTGWSSQNQAQLHSYGDNNLNGNTVDGTPTMTIGLQ